MKFSLEDLVSYFSDQGAVLLLESQSADHPWSRKSYLAAMPEKELRAWDDRVCVTDTDMDGEHFRNENPWEALQQFYHENNGWIFGYLGYDLKNHLEQLSSNNTDPVQAPDLYFMAPRFLLEYDAGTSEYTILKGELPDEESIGSVPAATQFEIESFHCPTPRDYYLGQIKEAQRRIAEGLFYEINLSHQFRGAFSGSPLGLYRRMKEIGPVPFGAYISTGDVDTCCQSPERFLRKEGKTVFSQPIKGTTGRGRDADEDASLKERLLMSDKERAENLMIVDLVRNDLSRIARRGSVKVPKLFNIESFGTLHQMVSTVTAEAEEEDPVEILKACFPMGSMTGAPKISAMKSIEELENYRRGIYSGAIGYITPSGDFDFNVVIRSAIIKNGLLTYAAGGAITGDSDPVSEWEETHIKARALTNVLPDTLTSERAGGRKDI